MEILEYIKSEILRIGYPPAVREICEAVSLKSTSSVHSHLETLEKNDIEEKLRLVDNERLFVIAEAIRKEISVERISELTTIDRFFIGAIYKLIKMEKELEKIEKKKKEVKRSLEELTK